MVVFVTLWGKRMLKIIKLVLVVVNLLLVSVVNAGVELGTNKIFGDDLRSQSFVVTELKLNDNFDAFVLVLNGGISRKIDIIAHDDAVIDLGLDTDLNKSNSLGIKSSITVSF
jgi:hypothetical protein